MTELVDRGPSALCAVCLKKKLRRDNLSGICSKCRRANHAATRCLCGCGRIRDTRNGSGLARPCRLRMAYRVAEALAQIANEHGAAASDLIRACSTFASRPYSGTARARLDRAFLAYYAAPCPTFLGAGSTT